MGKKVKKGFLFYLLILLGALLAAFLICVTIMVLTPGFEIFGLSYYNNEDIKLYDRAVIYTSAGEDGTAVMEGSTISEQLIKNSTINNIEIETNNHSVILYEPNATDGPNYTEFHISIKTDINGFTTTKASLQKEVIYYQDTQTLYIKVITPDGFWVTGNNSSIVVQIPSSYNMSNVHVKIHSGKGSITIGDSVTDDNLAPSTLEIKSIDLMTSSVIAITEYVSIGAINTGNCYIETEGAVSVATTINAVTLTIKGKGQNLKFNQNGTAFKVANWLDLQSNGSYMYFGGIEASYVMLTNTYGKMYFEKAITAANVLITEASKQCDYDFESISGNLTAGVKAIEATETVEGVPEHRLDDCNIKVKNTIGGTVTIVTSGTVNPTTLVA